MTGEIKMTNRIYIANLGKYNEGILQGEWFEFPIDMADVKERIGLDAQYEEFAIHDYELPFSIGEYENIDKLNEIMETIDGNDDLMKLVDILNSDEKYDCNNWGELAYNVFSDLVDDHDIVDDEFITRSIASKINDEESDWEGVKHYLVNANVNNQYHIIDGYANIVELDYKYAQSVLVDYFSDLKR